MYQKYISHLSIGNGPALYLAQRGRAMCSKRSQRPSTRRPASNPSIWEAVESRLELQVVELKRSWRSAVRKLERLERRADTSTRRLATWFSNLPAEVCRAELETRRADTFSFRARFSLISTCQHNIIGKIGRNKKVLLIPPPPC